MVCLVGGGMSEGRLNTYLFCLEFGKHGEGLSRTNIQDMGCSQLSGNQSGPNASSLAVADSVGSCSVLEATSKSSRQMYIINKPAKLSSMLRMAHFEEPPDSSCVRGFVRFLCWKQRGVQTERKLIR